MKNYAIVDLHLHLDGSLSPEIIIEIAKEEGINLPSYDPKELRKYLEVSPNCQSLEEYLQKFEIPNLVLQSKNGLRKALLDLLKRLDKQGLKYVEVRMAPQLSITKGLTQEEVVQALIDARNEAQKLYQIKCNLILCMMRGENNKDLNIETAKLAIKYMNKGVVAIDLAGDEAKYPNENFEEELTISRDEKTGKYIKKTIHAGEACGPESIWSALHYDPDRFGHGIHFYEDDILPDVIDKLEICPTSNLQTKAIHSLSEFPFRLMLDKKIKFNVNTDNMTVSNTTLKKEYDLLRQYGLNEDELKKVALMSIDMAFISKEEKEELRKFVE